MFSSREPRRRGASARIIQRISQKQRGARSGSAGYRQEDFFAVGQMIAAARRFLEHGEHFWMIQNAEALVDDVVTGKDLQALCAGRGGAGDIASIAAYAFVTVLDRPAKPKRYEVSTFLNQLRENDSVPLRSPFLDTSSLWKRASGILAKIPGLQVSIADGFVVFDYRNGLESGRAARCGTAAYRRFLERIVRSSPKTFDDFERLL